MGLASLALNHPNVNPSPPPHPVARRKTGRDIRDIRMVGMHAQLRDVCARHCRETFVLKPTFGRSALRMMLPSRQHQSALAEALRLDAVCSTAGSNRRGGSLGSKATRTNALATVLLDLHGLATQSRPATLLNLLHLPTAILNSPHLALSSHTAAALRTIIDDMVQTARHTTVHAIRLLVSDDCLLAVDCDTLASWMPLPRGIRFVDDDVRWMDEGEQAGLVRRLERLRGRLCELSSMAPSTATSYTLEAFLADDCERALSLPTVYGYILGYPCTYEVMDRAHAGVVSRWLSSSTLVFYYCREGGREHVLLSFSVPKPLLLADADATRGGWLAGWLETRKTFALTSEVKRHCHIAI